MRVLYYLDTVNRGGAETQALEVCRNAAAYGIELTMVAGGGGGLESDFRDSGVEFIMLRRRLPVDLRIASQIRKIIKERDIKIVHGYQAVEGLHLYLATRWSSAKTVLSYQGIIPGAKNRIVTRVIARLMDSNVAVSRSVLKYLAEDIGVTNTERFEVVYNGADPARLLPGGNSIRNELGLPDNAVLGGMVANFTVGKDQLTLVRALVTVIADHPELHFVFVGRITDSSGDSATRCEELCKETGIDTNVQFLGARSDVPDILSELDLFVLSSEIEGLSVAVSEAMLAGVPVILSDIDSLREMSNDGEFAELFACGDPVELARKIELIISDRGHRTNLASRARQFAIDNFSIAAHMTSLRELYGSLLDR